VTDLRHDVLRERIVINVTGRVREKGSRSPTTTARARPNRTGSS